MIHATDKNERKKENGVPHPDPLVKCVNTHVADCLLGVKTSRAMQIAIEARTLMGMNQVTIW